MASSVLQLPATAARPWRLALAWLVGLGPFFYLSYGFANHLAAQAALRGQVPSIVFGWEHGIAFWPWTIFPYWSINAFYALSLFICTSRKMVMRHGMRLLTAQLVAVSCFILWPLAFSFGQPAVEGAPALLFNALRGFDKPFNQAPSLHIALAVILWDLYRRFIHAGWARALLHGWTLLICASVLTTYQHHFIDIPTGALLGVVCVWLWPLQGADTTPWADLRRPDAKATRLALAYASGAVLAAACAAGGWRHAAGGWALWLWWPALALLLVAVCYAVLGANGFAMQADGRMRWAARWLYAPYRGGAWLNARIWTRGQPLAHQVLPGVWLGRLPSATEWRAAGQPALMSLCAELQAPAVAVASGQAHCLPMLDLVAPTPAALQCASAMLQQAWQHQKKASAHAPLWVCCALGYSRSAAALAVWLVRYGHCTCVEQALGLIRGARPQVVLAQPYIKAIHRAVGERHAC